ncbi:sensor domain-containing protein [Nonomuraea sp. NPDC050556]|uniref:sensor domain-containing protein n=1 Tax=Nonomuraea sp. NPDC050556 TaxID=3364369 RepID=UPI00378CF36F
MITKEGLPRMKRAMIGLMAAGVSVLLLSAPAYASPTIPKGFLKYENKQARKAFGSMDWQVTSDLAELGALNACPKKTSTLHNALALRSALGSGDSDFHVAEQVAVFKDAKAAKAVMAKYLATVKACAKVKTAGGSPATYRATPVSIGDEAFLVAHYSFKKDDVGYGERDVFARRGSAVILYAVNGPYMTAKPKRKEFAPYEAAAKAMAKKVCQLPGVC